MLQASAQVTKVPGSKDWLFYCLPQADELFFKEKNIDTIRPIVVPLERDKERYRTGKEHFNIYN